MNWRWYCFWINDFIHGGKIHKAYKDIKECYYNGNKHIENDVNNLIQHAKKTSKFYSKFNTDKIEEFPVINKSVIVNNYDEIRSNLYLQENLHKMSTSGSTGTPLTVVQDARKRKRVIAEVIFFGKICGYTFGQRQVFFRVWVNSVKKSKLKKVLQNMITEDISNLDERKMQEIENILKNDKKIKNILSYASTLGQVSKYLKEKGYKPEDFSVTSIISGSELLQDETRKNLKEIFDCNIVSRYSNEENGILGQECISNKEIHLNTSSYYFEFLKLDEDKPAEKGELARIVVTDLYNYALPMIRYDTGDLAIVGESKCTIKANVIKEIFGRKVDLIYNTNGETLSPHTITNNMWGVSNIKQFKFTQMNENDYKILLNVDENFKREKAERELREKFITLLGENAIISFEYTDEIPVLASGKRKYIENLYRR